MARDRDGLNHTIELSDTIELDNQNFIIQTNHDWWVEKDLRHEATHNYMKNLQN